MRIILMLRRVLSFLLVCVLAAQSVAAVAAGLPGAAEAQACHDVQHPSPHDGTSTDCAVHCLTAAALPLFVPLVAAMPSPVYDRIEIAGAPARFDVPPNPPPIR
jgi:hypothetical protein